jgi:carboxylesterase
MGKVSAIPDAEPFELPGGDIAVLMVHGFTGSPASIKPWASALHKSGFSVLVPRLPGHGTHWPEMNQTTWRDWYFEVLRNFDDLRSRKARVFVAGFSMGGALSLRLALDRGEEIEGLILVNPSVHDNRKIMKLVPILKHFIPSVGGRGTDVARPNPPRHSYGRTPLKALHSLQDLWREVRTNLHRIHTPLMIGYSINDHVVNPKNSELVIEGVSSQDIREIIFERSFHNVALDHDAEVLAEESITFIRDVLAGRISRSELDIDSQFESIVAGLNLDQSSPSTFLDEIEGIEAAQRYEGDNRPLPTLTPVQRGALLGVTLGPAYILTTSLTSFDPIGLGPWPGLLALVAGILAFFWQMKREGEEGDGAAL